MKRILAVVTAGVLAAGSLTGCNWLAPSCDTMRAPAASAELEGKGKPSKPKKKPTKPTKPTKKPNSDGDCD